ncbi:O-antigen polymerase [Polaromonas sp.]|uniref:O-antigen polymerase n=1 Tax=Polaromonas sp. TaxID=1869339 RepID=UPI001DD518FE|nr:O-antigen polymerase [Polaromonas sp.]MBT9475503.1 oligosaccharide repeat unit polymerase [Polaromonas sp.]
MFSPRFIFLSLWGMQIALHMGFSDIFFPFAFTTWVAVITGVLFFNLGVSVANYFPGLRYSYPVLLVGGGQKVQLSNYLWTFLVIYISAGIFAVYSILSMLLGSGLEELTAPAIRQLVIDDFNGDRNLYVYFRILYLGVGFSIFFLAFSKYLSRTQIIFIFLVGLVSAVATTGRLYLLLFFVASIALLYRNKVISGRTVFLSALSFLSIFFIIALVFQKGEESDSVAGSLLWNAQVYVMSSASCFNDYVVSRSQEISGGALLPNPLRELLGYFIFDMPQKPTLNPFSEVPLPCNTYTILFPLFHDGSFIGVAAGMLILGVFHQFLYMRYKYSENPIWWYLYGVSIYPLVMSVFEDAYFSSPGFWLLLWMPPTCYLIARRLHLIRVSHLEKI